MNKTETLNLRISASFKRRLLVEARRENRSVTNYIEATLKRVWEGDSRSVSKKKEPIQQS